MLSRMCSYSSESTGNIPQKTTGWEGLKPGNTSSVGVLSSVIVSPTLQSETLLMPELIKPISPGPKESISIALGENIPTLSIVCWLSTKKR